jgi:modulator of FtsH protease
MDAWDGFLIAEVGASAALVGLIFVAVSLNLPKILESRALPSRALQALIFLGTVLILSSLLLITNLSVMGAGIIILVGGLCLWGATSRMDLDTYHQVEAAYRGFAVRNAIFDQFAVLAYVLTGIAVLIWGTPALAGLGIAVAISFFKALMDAWVLLVEINR